MNFFAFLRFYFIILYYANCKIFWQINLSQPNLVFSTTRGQVTASGRSAELLSLSPAIRSCSGRSQLCFELELVCSLEFARPCVYRKHHHHCIWLPRTVHSADAAVRTGIKKLGESLLHEKNREWGRDSWDRQERVEVKEQERIRVFLLSLLMSM